MQVKLLCWLLLLAVGGVGGGGVCIGLICVDLFEGRFRFPISNHLVHVRGFKQVQCVV